MKDLTEQLHTAIESAKSVRGQKQFLKKELDQLTSDLQISKRGHRHLEAQIKDSEKEINELKQQNSRFKEALQVRGATKSKAACSIDNASLSFFVASLSSFVKMSQKVSEKLFYSSFLS